MWRRGREEGGGYGGWAHPALNTASEGVRAVGGGGGRSNGVPDTDSRGEEGVPEGKYKKVNMVRNFHRNHKAY